MTELFRERALEKISSPEELDEIVAITPPRRWLALAALLVAVTAAVIWATVSTVPTTLSGIGYLLPLDGLSAIQAPLAGTVQNLTLQPGSHVVAGETVAQIRAADGRSVPVVAPKTGVISELDTLPGVRANAGQRLALIEPVGWPLVVYAYVPTNVAASLTPGTPTRVTLNGGFGGYGYISGHVDSVSSFAVTHDRLAFILQGTSVVSQVARLGAVNEVVIVLDQTAETASGLVWSSGAGPRAAPPAGLSGAVQFITGSRHPIDDVL